MHGDGILRRSPPRMRTPILMRTIHKPPVLRPRRYDYLSRRARLVRDDFAHSARLPALVAKRRRNCCGNGEMAKGMRRPDNDENGAFEMAIRYLAGDFLTIPQKPKKAENVESDSERERDSDDEVVFVPPERERQARTHD